MELDHVRTLVLNALLALFDSPSSQGPDFLADDASRRVLRDAYHAATTAAERDRFQRTATRARRTDALTEEGAVEQLREVTTAVIVELDDRDVTALVDHRAQLSLAGRDAHLSTFGNGKDPGVLDRLEFPSAIAQHVDSGGECVREGEFSRAAEAFERAVTEHSAPGATIATRILAAQANHWSERDDRAIDFVEEALHLDTDAWSARLIGLAAGHRYPDRFRRGKLSAQAFLRYTIDTPADSGVRPQVGFGTPSARTWHDLDGTAKCYPIERLEPKTWVRLRLRGTFPAFPAVHGYYVGLGVIDCEVFEVRDVERVLVSGPQTASSTETLRLER